MHVGMMIETTPTKREAPHITLRLGIRQKVKQTKSATNCRDIPGSENRTEIDVAETALGPSDSTHVAQIQGQATRKTDE
jgi:hypothetical protein